MKYEDAAMILSNGQFSNTNPKLLPCNDFAQAFIFDEEVFYNFRDQLIIKMPKGFYTDGISSPGRFNNNWYGISKHGPYAIAGYLHDRLYFSPYAYDTKLKCEVRLTRKQTDQIFRHACKSLDCPGWRANIATVCLYIAGWFPFYLHRIKEHYRYSQAWNLDHTELLYEHHTRYPQRLVKLSVRALQKLR